MRAKRRIPCGRPCSTALVTGCALSLLAGHARGSGFYLTERGVRSLGRGGAFVAGVDDAHGVWFNPAGLAHAGRSFLADATYLGFSATYTRRSLAMGMPVDGYAPVRSSVPPLAIPTLAVTHDFGLRRANFAFAVFAPNAAIPSYPDTLAPTDPAGRLSAPAPQRYSSYSMNGSALAMAGVYASFKPSDVFAVGAGVVALAGTFVSRLALTACPATITCQPEDPQWDAESYVQAFPIFAPSGTFGVQIAPAPWLRIGVSGQLPFWVDAPAKLQVRLPAHPFYTNDPPTSVEGSDASLRFMLAPIVRAGVEVRPTPRDRIEATFVWEGWDVHDAILLRPTGGGIRLRNVRGVGTYEIGPQVIARGWQNSVSARLGYEREQSLPGRWVLTPRAGVSVDTSATPEAYTSVLTLDALKVIGAVGLGLGRDRWRFDASFAYAYSPPVVVDPTVARIPQVAPFRQSADAPRTYVNGGRYEMSTFVLGVGLQHRW